MTAENFPASLKFTLVEEGGNSDDPHDHGGRTSRGIIQREWDVYRRSHPDRPTDVYQASNDDIHTIYHDQYWEPYCDKLPGGVDLAFFDLCVNGGRQQAVKTLQKALGLKADGMLGMATADAVAHAHAGSLVHAYSDQRRKFYRALAQFPRYGKDWIGRTDRCEMAAHKLVVEATTPIAEPATVEAPASPKANPEDIKQPPVAPEKGVAVSGGAGGLAGMIPQVQEQLQPYADTLKIVQYILIVIAVLGLGFTMYGLWHQKKMKEIVA
jgi:lysozyme family protein